MLNSRQFIMEARGKSKKKRTGDSAKRSRFLSLVMPQLAGDNGKALADALESKDFEKFKSLWSSTSSQVMTKAEKQIKGNTDEIDGDSIK